MWAWILTLIVDNIGLVPLICFFSLICIYIYVTKKMEFFWFILYYFLCLYFLLLILFFYADVLLNYFLNEVLEPILVTNPAIFTQNYVYFIFYLSFFLSMPFLIGICNYFFSSVRYTKFTVFYNFFSFFLIFGLQSIFWIIKSDIFFANWFSLAYVPQFGALFDFQPQFENFLLYFWIEYKDFFLFFFICIYLPFYFIIKGFLTTLHFHQYILLFIINFLLVLYFFFEFLNVNNVILFILLFLFFFLCRLCIFILLISKRYKKLNLNPE